MTVSPSQVRTYLLAKHHLLNRDGVDAESVADDLVGLHATSNVTPYLSLFNRIKHFSPDDLNDELYRKKSLVRVRAMRGTFFLFTRRLLPIAAEATEFPPERVGKSLTHAGISVGEFEKLSKLILNCLASGPMTLPEIKRDVSRESSRSLDWKRGRRVTRRTNLGVVLQLLLVQRKVQSQPEPIKWKSIDWDGYGTRTFTRIRKVMYRQVSIPETASTNEGAKLKLAELYIKQYGPVTVHDVAWWMDESKPEVLRLLARLRDKLTNIRIPRHVDDFLLHPDDLPVLQKTREVDDCVRFLPYEDPYSKSRKNRGLMIPKASERQAYVTGNALPSVISNGKIVGTWSLAADDDEKATVNVKRLAPINREIESRIFEEGHRLGAFLYGERSVTVSLSQTDRTLMGEAHPLLSRECPSRQAG